MSFNLAMIPNTTGYCAAMFEVGDLMNENLGSVIALVFLVLALWHFYMAQCPLSGESSAVPSKDGKPIFVPSRASTNAVGLVLCLFAALVAATAGLIASGLPPTLLKWLSLTLALGLLARSVGEFRYVGFFKRVRGGRFATMDTFLYSPLCLALSLGIAFVAAGRDT